MNMNASNVRQRGSFAISCFLLALLMLVVAVPPVTAAQVSADLSIEDVQPIQVIQGVPLVLGKATVVRVSVGVKAVQGSGNIPATIVLSFAGRDYTQAVTLQSGQELQIVDIFPAAPAELSPVAANARITPGSGWSDPNPSNNTLAAPVVLDVLQAQDKSIHLVFMPVDWTEADLQKFADARGSYREQFAQYVAKYADDNAAYLQAVFPVVESKVVYTYTLVPHNLTPVERGGVGGSVLNNDFFTLLASVFYAGREYDPEATVVIALMPPGWFAKRGERGTLGITSLQFKGVTLNEIVIGTPSTDVPAHETGHQYGLYEDYNYRDRKNARVGYPIDVPGYYVTEKIPVPVTTDRSRQVLAFMAGGDGRKNTRTNIVRWADSPTYWWLIGQLASRWTGQPQISRIVTATELDPSGTGKYYMPADTFTAGTDKVVYLSAFAHYLRPGQQVSIKWYRNNRVIFEDNPVGIRDSRAFRYIAFSIYAKNGLQAGEYAAEVYLDGQKQQTTTFTVK